MATHRWDLSTSERKIEELGHVLADSKRRSILIVAHNNPDPDAIAAAYGFSFLLRKKFGVRSTIGYGGVVTRAENKAMVQRLRIKMARLERLDPSRYHGIALVDAQPGTGNSLVHGRAEPPLIVIDHHPLRTRSLKAPFHDIRSGYGSTSTIVTEYIAAAGLTVSRSVANALLYGTKTDTNSLCRDTHDVDLQAFNHLSPKTNPRVVGWIEHPHLPLAYFADYHRGLSQATLYKDVAVSYLGRIDSEAIIPELADLLLRIEGVHWSLCFGTVRESMILSVRSTSKKQMAGTVIRRLCGSIGFCGGHRRLAGGLIPLSRKDEAGVQDFAQKIIDRFLGLIGVQECRPRPLVQAGIDSP